jgi:hypothetical protein
MREACSLDWSVLLFWFRSRVSLEAEIPIFRHQRNIQRRHPPKRLAFSAMDRLIFVGLYHLVPSTLKALTPVKLETVIRRLKIVLVLEVTTLFRPTDGYGRQLLHNGCVALIYRRPCSICTTWCGTQFHSTFSKRILRGISCRTLPANVECARSHLRRHRLQPRRSH